MILDALLSITTKFMRTTRPELLIKANGSIGEHLQEFANIRLANIVIW
jgi:hypothetical protein